MRAVNFSLIASLLSSRSLSLHTPSHTTGTRTLSMSGTKSIKSFFSAQSSGGSKKRSVEDTIDVDQVNEGDEESTKQPKVISTSDAPEEVTSPVSEPEAVAPPSAPEAEALPSVGWPPLDALEPSWRRRLLPEYQKPYFQRLMQFLASESKSQTIFPPSNQLFTALNLCPFDSVKVVIIGQDPYHGPGQAHGLAFSVQKGVQIPPSLRNMITEAQNDPEVRIRAPTHGNLESWARQGVLLLNTVLTVRKADANSHQKKGWEDFTDAVVRELGKKEGLVYLLWGKPAQAKCTGIDHRKNKILTSSHPSPLSAYKTSEPFIGSKMFSRCNNALRELEKEPIDWTIR